QRMKNAHMLPTDKDTTRRRRRREGERGNLFRIHLRYAAPALSKLFRGYTVYT
ncbi:hypothetical protein U1Q18_052137, partial [Sarracenia purpurea var. burkii]